MNKARKIIELYRSIFIKKEDICVFGSWWGNKFADNPKYLYLYFLKRGVNAVWITKSKEIYNQMKSESLPVCMADSKEGEECCRKAKYVFYCTDVSDVNEYCVGGAYLVNLWHGIPLKKIMYDDKINNTHRSLKSFIWDTVTKIPYRKRYVVSTSKAISSIYESAFRIDRRHILEWGQPRNDCFFDGTIKRKKYGDIEYDRMILYMPTHRKEGKQPICISELFDLERLEKYCKANNTLFLIKKHFYHREEYTDLQAYPHIADYTREACDTQELLFHADVLITDYSSCYIDYLLLDRPVLFYAYDYEEYLKEDREMYFEFEEVTPGPKVRDFDTLLCELEHVVKDDLGNYREQHSKVKRIFFSEQNEKQVSLQILRSLKALKG